MQLPYKTKQNQQNNKNKVENDIIVEVIVCHCCRFGCCCFEPNQQTKTNYLKKIGLSPKKTNKTKQTNKTTFIYILLLLFILVYFIGSKIAKTNS